jgi:hypothetical protein
MDGVLAAFAQFDSRARPCSPLCSPFWIIGEIDLSNTELGRADSLTD